MTHILFTTFFISLVKFKEVSIYNSNASRYIISIYTTSIRSEKLIIYSEHIIFINATHSLHAQQPSKIPLSRKTNERRARIRGRDESSECRYPLPCRSSHIGCIYHIYIIHGIIYTGHEQAARITSATNSNNYSGLPPFSRMNDRPSRRVSSLKRPNWLDEYAGTAATNTQAQRERINRDAALWRA